MPLMPVIYKIPNKTLLKITEKMMIVGLQSGGYITYKD